MENIVSVHDVSDIFRVPLLLLDQSITQIIAARLQMYLPKGLPRLLPWKALVQRIEDLSQDVHIALVGKYTVLSDAYLSVTRALQHATIAVGRRLVIDWVDSSMLEASHSDASERDAAWAVVKSADGILVPGGFGERGTEGKLETIKFAREHKKPFLGICLGLQLAVIEYCRSVLGLADANSTEFKEATLNPVVVFMPEVPKGQMGGTMRLGSRPTVIQCANSISAVLYGGAEVVNERHRHRFHRPPPPRRLLTAQVRSQPRLRQQDRRGRPSLRRQGHGRRADGNRRVARWDPSLLLRHTIPPRIQIKSPSTRAGVPRPVARCVGAGSERPLGGACCAIFFDVKWSGD